MMEILDPETTAKRADLATLLADNGLNHLTTSVEHGWNYLLDHVWIIERMQEYLVEKSPSPKVVLDVGCGKSRFHNLLERLFALDILGIERPHGFCHQESAQNVDFYTDFLQFNEFAENSVDIIYWLSSIEHNKKEAIKELFHKSMSLLKNGGLFLATFAISENTHWFEDSQQTNLSLSDAALLFEISELHGAFRQIRENYRSNILLLKDKYRERYKIFGDNDPAFVVGAVRKVKTSGSPVKWDFRERAGEDASLHVFVPSNDTHVHWMYPIAQKVSRHRFMIFPGRNENAERHLRELGEEYLVYRPGALRELRASVVSFGNDWGKEEREILAEARSGGIPTVCIQEGPLDFADQTVRRMMTADYVFLQGPKMLEHAGERKDIRITGNPKYDALQEVPVPSRATVMVNVNFTYGVYEDARSQWVTEVVTACKELGLDFFISQHPRDQGTFPKEYPIVKSDAFRLEEQLKRASILVSRFSTVIYEALMMGREVIYYNPHGEPFPIFSRDDTGGVLTASNYSELISALKLITGTEFDNSERRREFLRQHCATFHPSATEMCVRNLEAIARKHSVRQREVRAQNESALVSVIVPTYNRPGMLAENLKSILSQTYQNIEIVVVNDGGADVENIISFLNDKGNVTYIKHGQNRGLAAARNTGIKVARGNYIAYLDDDDIYYPDHIKVLVDFLETHEEKVAYADALRAHQREERGKYVVTKRDLPYSFDFDPDRILRENFIPILCFVHERSCLDEVGYFDEGLRSHEDWDLWIRMSRKFKFAHINKITCEFTWREDGSSMTVSKKDEMDTSRRTVLDRGRRYLKEQDGGTRRVDVAPQRSKVEMGYQEILSRVANGKGEEGIGELKDFLEASPNHAEAHNDLGVLYFRSGNSDEALAHIERSVQLDPGRVDFQHNLADVYLETGRPEEAIEVYETILSRYPGDVETLLRIGSLCCEAGHPDEGALFYQKAIDIDPTNISAKQGLEAVDATQKTVAPAASSQDSCSSLSAILPPLNRHEASTCRPRVSIIIPVFNQLRLTHQCLKSIFANTRDVNWEVIVVDDGSTDGTTGYLKGIKAPCIKPIFQGENRGFVEACRAGAEAASGDYLLFLNNDTEVQPRWLSSLIELAEATPDWGAVGAKLVYPDGRLQEAGGIIFSDGSGWNYGRGMDPQDPRFNFVREVDYCSGAALMVKKKLWEDIGGFDRRYAPAYYEDTDLCFEIRKRGRKVYYQPESVVIHHEGKTAGTDLQYGHKRYQVVNRQKFIEKWSNELKNQQPNDPRKVMKASNRQAERSILVVDPFLPLFDRASGSLRLFEILKILLKMNFHVTFISRNASMETRYRPCLERMGIEVYAGDVGAIKAVGKTIENATPINYDLLFQEREFAYTIIGFWELAEYYLPLVRKLSPETCVIVDTVDIHFIREMREAELKKSDELKEKALRNKEREIAVYKRADRLWVVTEEDRKKIDALVGTVPIDVIPNIHQKIDVLKRFEETSDLLFVGNFNHGPNRDATQFFCREIFPLIVKELPDVKLYVVGNSPTDDVTALASNRVIVTGYVEDLSPYLRRSRVSVSPLRYGAGMKGKIGEALSWGLPVVTTTIGAEGMGLVDGEDAVIADSPRGFAEKVVMVYNDRELWNELSAKGRKKVEAQWSPEAVKSRLEAILGRPGSFRERGVVSIIILAHNQLEYTRKCLDSIFKYTDEPFELIIVDNGSGDGTPEYLNAVREGKVEVGGQRLEIDEPSNLVKSDGEGQGRVRSKKEARGKKGKRGKNRTQTMESVCRSFEVIRNEENQGFALGNNQGMTAATGDYLLLMNNDVVVTPGWLGRLIACSERKPQIGIVGPMSNYVSGPQLVKDIGYDSDSLVGLDRFAQEYREKHRGQAKGFWRVVGFCMLIKRAVVAKIGGLDGRYGLGNFEDDDFSLRATLAGFESWIAQDCFVHHFGNRTFIGARIDYNGSLQRNWEIFKKKWGVPLDLPYGASYDLRHVANRGFVAAEHYCPLRPEEVSVSQAEEIFRSGDVAEAKAMFERIVRADPRNAEALNNLGVIHFQQLELDKAISYFSCALGVNPDYFEAIENMGKCMIAQKSYQEAMQWFERAMDLKPDDVNLLNAFANCYIQIEDLQKAEEIYTRSRELDSKQPQVDEILGELERLKALGIERRTSP